MSEKKQNKNLNASPEKSNKLLDVSPSADGKESQSQKLSRDQLEKLQQILFQQKAASSSQNPKSDKKSKLRNKFTIKNILTFILQKMQKGVGIIDKFVNFVISEGQNADIAEEKDKSKTEEKDAETIKKHPNDEEIDYSGYYDINSNIIKESRAPIRFGIFALIFFFVLSFIWSVTAPLDSATVAIGTLVSNSNKKIISHHAGGIIKGFIGRTPKSGDLVFFRRFHPA